MQNTVCTAMLGSKLKWLDTCSISVQEMSACCQSPNALCTLLYPTSLATCFVMLIILVSTDTTCLPSMHMRTLLSWLFYWSLHQSILAGASVQLLGKQIGHPPAPLSWVGSIDPSTAGRMAPNSAVRATCQAQAVSD